MRNHVSKLRFRFSRWTAIPALALAFVISAAASDDDLRLRAELEPPKEWGKAEGDAEWRKDSDGRLRFRVDVEDVREDGDGTVLVKRDGVVVFHAKIKIDDGQGRLELDSDDYEKVPKLEKDDEVIVKDEDEEKVLTGTLEKD